MNTFNTVILLVQGAAVALTGAAVIGSLPKWLAVTALAVNGACLAVTARSTQNAATALKALTPPAPPST